LIIQKTTTKNLQPPSLVNIFKRQYINYSSVYASPDPGES